MSATTDHPTVTDARNADLSAVPDEWIVATKLDHHLSFYHKGGPLEDEERNRSIAIMASAGRGKWTVMCLAGYDDATPRLAIGVPLAEAVAVAVEEMQAVTAGSPATADADVGDDHQEETATDPVEEQSARDVLAGESGDEQADLIEFF